jgi:signal transduction histidine kinase
MAPSQPDTAAGSTDSPEGLTPSIAERIGGRWVISWQAYVLGSVVNTIMLALTGGSIGAEPVDPADAGPWVATGAFSAALVGLYALTINYTAFRHKRTRTIAPGLVIAFHFGVGVLFALGIIVGARVLQLPEPTPVVEFIVATGGIGLWWGLTMAMLLEARERFHRRRIELLDRRVAQEERAFRETEASSLLLDQLRRQVADELDSTRSRLLSRVTNADTDAGPATAAPPREDWWDLAVTIREAAHGTVRPMSHRLWEIAEGHNPAPRLAAVAWRAILWPRPSVLNTGIIVLIGYARAGIEARGPASGLAAAATLAAIISALFWGVGLVRIRRSPRAGVLFWLAFLLAQAVALAWLEILTPQGLTAVDVAASVAAMTISVLAPVFVASLNEARDDALQTIVANSQEAIALDLARERQVAALTVEYATFLHGSLQTKLMACAAGMELAARSQDGDQFRSALARALELLQQAHEPARDPQHQTLTGALEELAAQWTGLVEITISMVATSTTVNEADADITQLPGETIVAAAEFTQEAIANSVRHGAAEVIDIRAEIGQRELSLTVCDSPGGPPATADVPAHASGVGAHGPSGLGTQVMASLSGGHFDRWTRPGGGTCVRASIAIAP